MEFLSSERVLCVAAVVAVAAAAEEILMPARGGVRAGPGIVSLMEQGQLWERIGLLLREWNLSTPQREIPQLISVPLWFAARVTPQKPNRPVTKATGGRL